jgi:polygalacturonase
MLPSRSSSRLCLASTATWLLATALLACGGSNDATYKSSAAGASNNNAQAGSGATSGGSGAGPSATGGDAGSANPGSAGAATQSGGASGVSGASGSSGGSAGAAAAGAGAGNSAGAAGATPYPTTCDNLGPEPVIPAACTTLMATKSAPGGVLTDEAALDTAQIQAAIAACPSGQAVKLAVDGAKNAFLSGPLNLKSGVTLWIDTGVTLFASRNPRDFDAKAGQCSLGTGGAGNCLPLIGANGLTGAAVMGEGTVDGRGGEPIIGQEPLTWWQLNDDAHLNGDLTAPRLVQTSGGKNFTLYKVHFQNSPKFHIVIATNGYVVWGITIKTDPSSPNTDGVDPSTGNGVIAYNTISTGDDNIAIKGSDSAVDNIVVAHNHFGQGHGMSIGSETNASVKDVTVCDLSLDGTENGIRIKSDASRGGLVQAVSYTDVCMRGVKDPFVFDAYYSSATGTLIPNFQDISLHSVHILGGGTNTFRGYDATHISTINFDNVIFDDAGSATFKDQDTTFTFGPGPVNFTPTSGTGVTVTKNVTGTDAPKDCSAAWVTF